MKILKAQVQLNEGADKVILWAVKPNPFGNGMDKPTIGSMLTLNFDAPYDCGISYVETHFGVTPEIVNRRWVQENVNGS